jgi:hypothetical protein
MSVFCKELHQICSKLPKYKCGDLNRKTLPKNGIYIVFEEGELAHGVNRIVRVGTHTGQDNLPARLIEHFYNENKNRSIFRKTIGRVFLADDSYLSVWNMDYIPKKNRELFTKKINKKKQAEIEKQVSGYIRKNFSFVIIPVNNKDKVMDEATGLADDIITRNNLVTLRGYGLKIDGTEKHQDEIGLFFVSELTPQPPVKAQIIAVNEPRTLKFIVPPELAENVQYYIQIVTQTSAKSGGWLLKNIRKLRTDTAFMVNVP